MSDDPRSRERRILMYGSVAVVLILLVGRGVPSLVRWQQKNHEAASRAISEAENATRSVRLFRTGRRASRDRQMQEAKLDSALIHVSEAAFASVTLSQLISDIADENEVDLGPMAVRSDTVRRSRLLEVGLRTSLEGDLANVLWFLSEVERRPEALLIRELTISPQVAIGTTNAATRLRGELFVAAMVRIGGPGTKDGSP